MMGSIGNSGRGGPNSGRIFLRLSQPMRKLLSTSRSGQQEGRYRSLMRELDQRHGINREKLANLPSPQQLSDFITAEIKLFFSPDLIELSDEHSLSTLAEIASRGTRTIYIPNRGAKQIFVSGQPPAGTIDVFEAKASQLGVGTKQLPSGQQSVVVLPLVSSLARNMSLDQYPRHGALTVAKRAANAFDPNVDLRILRMIANDLAIVLATTDLTI